MPALPRGGVPVAVEVARELDAPVDVFVVRKLGVPAHPELAMGAIAADGVCVLSDSLIDELGIPRAVVEQVAARERLELERREHLYRSGRPMPVLRGPRRHPGGRWTGDGLDDGGRGDGATCAPAGASLVAAPAGAPETCDRLQRVADEALCAERPEMFNAVGLWYERFDQVTDAEVIDLLRESTNRRAFQDSM